MRRPTISVWLPLVLAVVPACIGNIGSGGPEGGTEPTGQDPEALCQTPSPGLAPLRRLNRTEYRYTVEDLFGVSADPTAEFPADNVVDGYDNNAQNTSISQLRADRLFDAAEAIAAAESAELEALLPCAPSAVDDACIDELIAVVGRRGYRRPLEAEEAAILRAVYDQGSEWPLAERVALVLQTILMAPQFVYRPEIGAGEPVAPGVVALSGFEIAARMAQLLWASTPDDALLDAAAAGALDTPEGIEAQARLMLDDDKGRRGLENFLMQWIDARGLATVVKDPTLFPEFDEALIASMNEQTARFFEEVVWSGDGGIAELLSAESASVDESLAELYGVDHPGGSEWITATFPEDERRGVLGLAGFLAAKSHALAPAPVQRGKFVRTRILCQDIPDPPDDVDISPPVPTEAETNRELLAQHSADPLCRSCHEYMDPIGFGLENFDAIGQFRTHEPNGLPIDASGELNHTDDADGAFYGAIELSERLAASEEVATCMGTQSFRYGYGRRATSDDDCSVQQLEAQRIAAGGSIRELLIALTLTDGFRFRRIPETTEEN